ncbi:hypothetical protein AAG570_002009 [Ranatra chinensis]|uniref:Uncharacterized protein n=1 Tax=Ranatra chinensis TaxID=642074 RepID=A0ABD0YAZ7_9HEMI
MHQTHLSATCALCGESHPANYRGCTVHTALQRKRKINQNSAKFFHAEIVPPLWHPGKRQTPWWKVKTLLSAFLLCQQTPLVYTSNIFRHLKQPNLCYIKKNSHRNSNRNIYQSSHCGDHNARTTILTRNLSCIHNRIHAQGCHNKSNSNISKPSHIQSTANNQFNNFDQDFNMPNNTKGGLSNN